MDSKVVEDLSHREDSRVFCRVVISFVIFFFVPIEDPTHKGRNKEEVAFSTGGSLGKVEDEGHVALDLALEQHLSCLDALPGSGDLDEDSTSISSCLLVKSDDTLGSFHSFGFVETEPGINLS